MLRLHVINVPMCVCAGEERDKLPFQDNLEEEGE